MGRSENIPPLDVQIKRMKQAVASVNKKVGLRASLESSLLIGERQSSNCKYTSCAYSSNNMFDCTWLQDIRCERQCLGRATDNRVIGVDGRKIKYRETPDEVALKKRVRKFLKVAMKIDKQEREKEIRAERARRMRQIRRVVDKIENEKARVSKVDIVGAPQYNIKSLI